MLRSARRPAWQNWRFNRAVSLGEKRKRAFRRRFRAFAIKMLVYENVKEEVREIN